MTFLVQHSLFGGNASTDVVVQFSTLKYKSLNDSCFNYLDN